MRPSVIFFYLLFFNLVTISICKSQIQKEITNEEISQRTADTIAKKSFSKMVAGTEDIPSIANYISFVPTDGKFTLSGNYFFQVPKHDITNKKRRSEYFAVGFNGSGSILGGTVANLLEKGKLNTGVDLGVRFSWRMNTPFVGSLSSESQEMAEKRKSLIIERGLKIDSVKNELSLITMKSKQVELSISEENRKINLVIADTAKIMDSIGACKTDSCRLKFTDSLISLRTKIFSGYQKISALRRDSIKFHEIYQLTLIKAGTKWRDRTPYQQDLSNRYGLNRIGLTYEDTLVNKIYKQYDDKIYEVESARPVAGIEIDWLSIIANLNRLSYRTYKSVLSFNDALQKNNFNGFNFGIQANFYKFNKPFGKSRLFNFALTYKKTNNLEDLTTSKLVDETIVLNGSTTRKASTEYNVYTDSVEVYKTVQLPLNYYRFFGKDLNFGWHGFALADWRNNGKNIYDLGAGFIFGLNNASMKRLFNMELFVTYKDIKKELADEDVTFWKQLQVGLSIAIPFMIYKN